MYAKSDHESSSSTSVIENYKEFMSKNPKKKYPMRKLIKNLDSTSLFDNYESDTTFTNSGNITRQNKVMSSNTVSKGVPMDWD